MHVYTYETHQEQKDPRRRQQWAALEGLPSVIRPLGLRLARAACYMVQFSHVSSALGPVSPRRARTAGYASIGQHWKAFPR
jgi:hypothetical protein